MRILGIDPGIAITGYGIIDYVGNKFKVIDYNAITTPAHTKLTSRLLTLSQELNIILDKYKPDVLSIEELFFNNNAKTALIVGQARGVVVVETTKRQIPIYEYTPLQVKQAVAGYGRADKKQMQNMVKMLLNLEKIPKPDDVADALGIAITHAHSYSPLTAEENRL